MPIDFTALKGATTDTQLGWVQPEPIMVPGLVWRCPPGLRLDSPVLSIATCVRRRDNGALSNVARPQSGDVFLDATRLVAVAHPMWAAEDARRGLVEVADLEELEDAMRILRRPFGGVRTDRVARPTTRTRLLVTADQRLGAAQNRAQRAIVAEALRCLDALTRAHPAEQFGLLLTCTVQQLGARDKQGCPGFFRRDRQSDERFEAGWVCHLAHLIGIEIFLPVREEAELPEVFAGSSGDDLWGSPGGAPGGPDEDFPF